MRGKGHPGGQGEVGWREASGCSWVWVGRKRLRGKACLRTCGWGKLKVLVEMRRWCQEVRGLLRDQGREVTCLGFEHRSDCIAYSLSKASQ